MCPQQESGAFLRKLLQNPPALPFEPALFPMLFAATREDSLISMEDLVALIERSQNLASRVLAIANSAFYGLERKVSTLRQAVKILGICEIRTLAVTAGMAAIFQNARLPESFDITALWKHQLKTATIAKTLAAELGPLADNPASAKEDRLDMAPDEAYITGLLHDIGKIFFASVCPEEWRAVETQWRESGLEYFAVENAYWNIDHGLVGAMILHHWNLPLLLTEPINWHHAPEKAPAYTMRTRLLAAADRIAHSDLDAEKSLCGKAAALLPAGSDPAALYAAIVQSLADADIDAVPAPDS